MFDVGAVQSCRSSGGVAFQVIGKVSKCGRPYSFFVEETKVAIVSDVS
jgi:hypothetical protein